MRLSDDGVRLLDNPTELFAMGKMIEQEYFEPNRNANTQSAMSQLQRKVN